MALRAHGPGGTAAPGSARDRRGRGGDRSGGTRPCSPGRARAGRCRSAERGPTARGRGAASGGPRADRRRGAAGRSGGRADRRDRKSTRLNSSHGYISYAVFCLKKKKQSAAKRVGITRTDVASSVALFI